MTTVIAAAGFALLLWWLSTGIILYLDGLHPHTFRWSMLLGTIALLVAIVGVARTAHDDSIAGAYGAFVSTLLIWGWLEMSFYMGYVTGPRRHRCAPGCRGWRHFGHAIQVSLYHELAIILLGAIVVALTWGAPSQIALWTFLVLAWMHESARLNVFLGVRNISASFVPAHMDHLHSFLRRRPMNALFPWSVTISTVVLVLVVQQILQPGLDQAAVVGLTFVATVLALAILEHWFLVIPFSADRLWRWALTSRPAVDPHDASSSDNPALHSAVAGEQSSR